MKLNVQVNYLCNISFKDVYMYAIPTITFILMVQILKLNI